MPDPILNQDFKEGESPVGVQLPNGRTAYKFSPDPCPQPGNYTIAKNTRQCGGELYRDHTFYFNNAAYDGYMMLVNANGTSPGYIFRDTVRNLCPSDEYLFTAWANNQDQCDLGTNVLFQVWTLSGQLIKEAQLGGANYVGFKVLFGAGGLYFDLPAGENAVVLTLRVISDARKCGNILTIDDIQLRTTGATVKSEFPGYNGWVNNGCYLNNPTFQMNAFITQNAPPNPAYQWQESNDLGLSWHDLSGETSLQLTKSFSRSDTFLYRIRTSKIENIANVNCSVFSNFLKIAIDSLPVVKVSSNSPVCSGAQLKFSAEGFGSYQWEGPNGFTDDSPVPGIYKTSLADSGIYTVHVKTLGGCPGSGSTEVKIIGSDLVLSADTSVCMGATVRLHASGGTDFSWSPAEGLSNPSGDAPVVKPTRSIVYTVISTANSGCINTGEVKITVLNTRELKAAFSAPAYVCPSTDSVRFTDQSTGGVQQWHWDFNNGLVSEDRDPGSINFTAAPGQSDFRVHLTVTDSVGCKADAISVLKIANTCLIGIPNAFTPNGDGLNDEFYPVNAFRATDITFRVYSRPGQLIFESKDFGRRWDGRVGGQTAPPGTYVWTLSYKEPNGKAVQLSGVVTLIR